MNNVEEQELARLKRRSREVYRQKLKKSRDAKRQEFISYINETKEKIHDSYIRQKVLRAIVSTYRESRQRNN